MVVETKIKSGGVWRTITDPEVKSGGVWRAIQTIEVKSGGIWREVFSAVSETVSPSTVAINNIRFGATCYAGVQFNLSGAETGSTNSGSWSNSRGNWLDSGDASNVWVQRVINSGTLNWVDSGSGRLNLATTRSFGVRQNTTGNHTVNMTYNFYDAASGGNLIGTATYQMQAAKDM